MNRVLLPLLALTVAVACHRDRFPGPSNEVPSTPAALPSGPQGSLVLTGEFRVGAHPRILLTADRLRGVEVLARTNHPSWGLVKRNCDEGLSKKISSGYMGEDWGNVALDLALCGRILNRPDYTKAGVEYLLALVDDHTEVGDKKGGDKAAQQDDGYAIRSRGFLGAIAYDWLHDALTPDQRQHVTGRFHAYVTWYKKDGYRPTEPWSNHFMGYFGAAGMAGIACDGDDPRGTEMRKHAREVWNKIIVPGYRMRLVGGDYPEGWQYARLIGTVLGFYADAEGRLLPSGPAKLVEELPWLRESIAFQNHALLPDMETMFDNADWSKKPARPFPLQLYGVAIALPKDDPVGRQAVFLARLAKRPGEETWNWLRAIGDDPARASEDPRKGPTSYLAKGTGTVFARTHWTEKAAWVSFNASPFFGDHQHLDQGHFEVARGEDRLIIDPGDYDSYSSTSHNVILVDDKKENLRWSPNQQVYSTQAQIARFEDVDGVAYALGEYTDAYNPDDYPQYKKTRSVTRAERELVFSRAPIATMQGDGVARVVIYDRLTVTKPSYAVTWAGHAGVEPEVTGPQVRVSVGRSTATISTLLPSGVTAKLLKEPTIHTDDIFMKNDPAEGINSARIEIASPKGKTERRFLHAIVVGATGETAPSPVKIEGEGIDGVAIDREAYLFTSAAPQKMAAAVSYKAPDLATKHMVFGLAPNGKYAVSPTREGAICKIALLPGGSSAASSAGVLTLNVTGCTVK